MENYSAIMQMFNGQRGKAESVVPSQTYKAHLDECIKVQEKIKEKLKENPELILVAIDTFQLIRNPTNDTS